MAKHYLSLEELVACCDRRLLALRAAHNAAERILMAIIIIEVGTV